MVQDLVLGEMEPYADAFLPAAPAIERDGHLTTWEGRGQRTRPVRAPRGSALPDWEIFARLARAIGADLGFATLDELHAELGQVLAPRPVDGFDFTVPAEPAPTREEGALTLFTYPLLVDEGRTSAGATELKAAQEARAFAELHETDAERLGVVEGAEVTLTTAAGAATVPARVTDAIARGTVFVPFNQPGLAANVLLDGSFTTLVTVTAEAAADDEPDDVPQDEPAAVGGAG